MDLERLLAEKKGVIQTHISQVFLTGKYAYKIKKPVNFGFLDFSTLKKRKFYCEQELKLNRRLSPELYLKVLPITNEGKIVDWAVMMRRLPQERIMNELLKKNAINKDILNKLAKIVADFHRKAKIDREYGGIKTIGFNWDENFEQTKKFIGKIIPKDNFNFIKRKVNDFVGKNKNLFQERVKEGKIRWCHGDLHSGNIFVAKNKIYIFDCIEFNKRFAVQDVVADAAFLAMDLEFYRKKWAADFFIKNYLKETDDFEILKLLNFYKCYLAFVRGKINSFENKNRKAKKYFKLAQEYAKNL
ncbi:MAG: phosphotransferase [Candidatus Wildermuthbacteria bacterium]|nr:phosphotransferase [Candidatus Wildermuthbacteria bacterium]